jgi:hypothetical protein
LSRTKHAVEIMRLNILETTEKETVDTEKILKYLIFCLHCELLNEKLIYYAMGITIPADCGFRQD